MKLSIIQLRRIIREAIKGEPRHGYMVPRFETSEDAMLFMDELEPHDTVMQDVIDPQTGEIYLEAGETPIEAGWVEDPDAPEETDKDELDHYDWDAWEEEREAENERREQEYEAALNVAREYALAAGEDWAKDSLYDASRTYRQQGYSSPIEMVEAQAQDVAGDMGYNVEYWLPDEAAEVYRSLPDEQPNSYVGHAFLPSKAIFKDIMADYYYEGVSMALESEGHKYADDAE